MSGNFDNRRRPELAEAPSSCEPVVLPIDAAVCEHLSQGYWDWRAAFDRDPYASPLQHPDYVLSELATGRIKSRLNAVVVRDGADDNHPTLGILVPKTVRTSQVSGIGPGWTLQGLRLAGGRALGDVASPGQLNRMLKRATRHAADSGADFLLIEDLDTATPLYRAVQEHASHGCQLFASHDFQPRRYIDFPESESEYWATFSSRSLSKFRRNLKKFGRTELQRVSEIDQVPDFLRAAHEISKESWQSCQFGLRIRNDDAELRQLTILAQHGMLRSYLWWIEGRPAAFAVCNQHGGCFRYEEIAYRAEYGQFSPGRTMLHQIVEDLLRHDSPSVLDFGGGDAEYKQQFANRESSSGSVWLVPQAPRAQVTLKYLKLCRWIRSTGRAVLLQAGLGTRARQWIRSRRSTVESATREESQPAPTAVSANFEK